MFMKKRTPINEGAGQDIEAPSASAPVSDEPPNPEPLPPIDSTIVAQTAYAIVAEELKWKGDFPEWDKISSRAQDLYVQGAAHVLGGGAPRTRFEEIVVEVLGANTTSAPAVENAGSASNE